MGRHKPIIAWDSRGEYYSLESRVAAAQWLIGQGYKLAQSTLLTGIKTAIGSGKKYCGYRWEEEEPMPLEQMRPQPVQPVAAEKPIVPHWEKKDYQDEADAANELIDASRSALYERTMGVKSALYKDLPLHVSEEDMRRQHIKEYEYNLGLVTEEGILSCNDLGELVQYTKLPLYKHDLEEIINNGQFHQYTVLVNPSMIEQLENILREFS